MGVDLEHARAAKKRMLALLPETAKVNGVGITQIGDDYAVRVNLEEPLRDDLSLPDSINGVPVVVKVVGRIAKRIPPR